MSVRYPPETCDPLLDEPSPEIAVDHPALGPRYRFGEASILDSLTSRIADEPLGLEYPHARSIAQ